MGEMLLHGEPPIAVKVVVSARAKRMSLRVSRVDGAVRLSLPKRASQAEAREFLNEKANWIRKHVEAHVPANTLAFGGTVPYLGQDHLIVVGKGRRAVAQQGEIHCPPSDAMLGPRIKALFKAEARQTLTQASQTYAQMIGRTPNRIVLKDTRSRWGSCSSQGNLNYSWRLIMAPPEVLDYVAAHEVAHLRHMDHSHRFWGLVGEICPGFEAPRRWLRQHGGALHSIDFDTGA